MQLRVYYRYDTLSDNVDGKEGDDSNQRMSKLNEIMDTIASKAKDSYLGSLLVYRLDGSDLYLLSVDITELVVDIRKVGIR